MPILDNPIYDNCLFIKLIISYPLVFLNIFFNILITIRGDKLKYY